MDVKECRRNTSLIKLKCLLCCLRVSPIDYPGSSGTSDRGTVRRAKGSNEFRRQNWEAKYHHLPMVHTVRRLGEDPAHDPDVGREGIGSVTARDRSPLDDVVSGRLTSSKNGGGV